MIVSVIIGVIILLAVISAIRYVAKKGSCAGCGKDKSSCSACGEFKNFQTVAEKLAREDRTKS